MWTEWRTVIANITSSPSLPLPSLSTSSAYRYHFPLLFLSSSFLLLRVFFLLLVVPLFFPSLATSFISFFFGTFFITLLSSPLFHIISAYCLRSLSPPPLCLSPPLLLLSPPLPHCLYHTVSPKHLTL